MPSEASIRNTLTNPVIWECKIDTPFDFWQNYVPGDRWSQHLGLKLYTSPVEISTGRGRKFWIYFPPQLQDRVWYAQTLLVGESTCYELYFTVRASLRNALEWSLRVVASPRKSHFFGGYNVPDVCLLAPPDAMICAPSDPHFSDENFDILSSRV